MGDLNFSNEEIELVLNGLWVKNSSDGSGLTTKILAKQVRKK